MSVWPKRCVRCTHLIYPANSKRQAADRLGMKFEAFDRAFHRARRRDDPRAVAA